MMLPATYGRLVARRPLHILMIATTIAGLSRNSNACRLRESTLCFVTTPTSGFVSYTYDAVAHVTSYAARQARYNRRVPPPSQRAFEAGAAMASKVSRICRDNGSERREIGNAFRLLFSPAIGMLHPISICEAIRPASAARRQKLRRAKPHPLLHCVSARGIKYFHPDCIFAAFTVLNRE
jgi:hypothetical protein